MWLTDQLSRLDQYFMSFGGNRLAFFAALAVLLGSTIALGIVHPKRIIENDFKKDSLGEYLFSTDKTFGYRADDLYRMLNHYDESGDHHKAHRCFIFLDLIYPFLYSIPAAIMIGCLLPLVAPTTYTKIHYLTLVPLAMAVFDILENLSMLLVINWHEADRSARHYGMVAFSSAMTMIKIILICATLFLLIFVPIIFLLLYIARHVARKKQPPAPASSV